MAYNLKTITKIIPFTDSDFELYIPWLEDLAREGLFVRKLYGIYGDFEKGEPAQLRYRIIPTAKGKAGEDEKAFFEENGWDYVCKKDGLSIFCKADDGSPDLFTDAVSFAERCRSWQFFMLAEIALYIVIAIFVSRMFRQLIFAESGGWLDALHVLGPVSLVSLILLLLLALFIAAWRSVSSIFLIRRIREGKLRLNRSYRKAVYRNKLILILYFILFVSAHLYAFRI